MSNRPRVPLPDQEMPDVQHLSRRVLRAARTSRPVDAPESKLKAVREAAKHAFPTAGVDQMLREIERGYQTRPDDRRR